MEQSTPSPFSEPPGRPENYPLWHGSTPMELFLEHTVRTEKFFVEGQGIRVRDAGGRWFIDGRSGCWNMGLGYSAQGVKDAIARQLDELPTATLLSYDRPAQVTVRYARALVDAVGGGLDYLRLGNTGSQMTETAVMMSRFMRVLEGNPSRTAVLSFAGSYHGLGPGGNAISGMAAGFDFCGPLLPDVHLVPAAGSWTDNVRAKIEELSAERVTCVILEPQMGVMGVIPDADDLRELARLCRQHGIHFIADEVTTGFGRIGAMSRCVDLGIRPDMLVLGKNLTSGYVPIAALLVTGEIYEKAARPNPPRFLPAGSATDGHPVAAAAGLAVLDIFERDGILAHVRTIGAHLSEQLGAIQEKRLGESRVAGAGLMLSFPLSESGGQSWPVPRREAFRRACEDRGLLVSSGAVGAWIVPPLVTTAEDGDEIAAIVDDALAAVLAETKEGAA
ncbi:Adenosylmethionine-8-amino-7-oxononanoate aminotransferase [Asanoa hainanensis]|uniref:Adenosylmethionine-8-amino-7-oxononanoate aminotransferase n=1 Tax=Asanoa hainanensis TaxID=560556 RepID=A0A239PET6_9ACTN|nr:aminotransferase class III-fold pyridoxal phosphate-dependent enzyme [Asanoa hainanensis]SNT65550.1 Adenosylmethionine-8-amino-7-oxononanoate aminotransferase [Asanoa hainanensis]